MTQFGRIYRKAAISGLVSCAVLLMPLLVQNAAAEIEVPREAVAARAQESIERVRANMNANPDIVQFELNEVLARSLGDDPRVLSLCEELVAKSTNTLTIRHALLAAFQIHQDFGAGSKTRLAKLFRKASKKREVAIRIDAAEFMSALGGPSRDEGRTMFERLRRETHDSNVVIERMIPTFGTNDDVIQYYGSCLRKSTSLAEAQQALVGLRTIAATHAKGASPEVREKIAAEFRAAFKLGSPAVQLDAAFYLSEMGGRYGSEARAFLEKRLREPFGDVPDREAAMWAGIRILRPMLQANNPSDYELLRDAARTNGLLDYFEMKFAADSGPGNSFNREMAARWKSIINR